MATEIWSANIIIGGDDNPIIIEKIAIKKLPIYLLLADEYFVKMIQHRCDKKAWDKLKKDKETGLPSIKTVYLKHLGDTAQEPFVND